jgi:hypothetical protein
LMVSKIQFFKLMPPKWNMGYLWPRLILVVVGAIAIPFLGAATVPFVIVLYIILSLIYREPQVVSGEEYGQA